MDHFVYSTELGSLNKALIAAKRNFDPILKDIKNPFYNSKYADLNGLIEATEKHLSEQGLVIIQSPLGETGQTGVTTMLLHESGQFVVGTLLLPAAQIGKDKVLKLDAQTGCSAITYARRYAYKGILGLAEEDDDANAATGNTNPQNGKSAAKNTNTKARQERPAKSDQPSQPTRAAIPAAPTAPGEPAPTPDFKSEPVVLPTPDELKKYYERAKTVAAELTKAGMTPKNGFLVGAQLVKFITKKTGYEALPAIPKEKWDLIINKLETAIKTDAKALIQIIEEAIKE